MEYQMTGTVHPHDRMFRKALSDKRVAQALLRKDLPEKILQRIDLNVLEPSKETYMESHFSSVSSDILFRTMIKDKSGYLYLLLEHQSKADRIMIN